MSHLSDGAFLTHISQFEKQVEEAREEAKKMRERNVEVVTSLERVETQYAMMGQKLSEAVEAMSTIKNKVEEMRSELEEKNYENQELQSELKVSCSFFKGFQQPLCVGVQHETGEPGGGELGLQGEAGGAADLQE